MFWWLINSKFRIIALSLCCPFWAKSLKELNTHILSIFLDQLGYLCKHQHEFKSGHSTQQAITLESKWLGPRGHGWRESHWPIVYQYFKSIDSQIHKVLLVKLESLGLSPRSLRWFRSYLADRCESVLINGELSDFSPITHDVPQGSILGPLLFNMYIYSLWNAVQNARVILYTDDADCANMCCVNLLRSSGGFST